MRTKFPNFMLLIKSRNFTVVSHNSDTPNSDTYQSLQYKSVTSTRHFKTNSSLRHVTDLCWRDVFKWWIFVEVTFLCWSNGFVLKFCGLKRSGPRSVELRGTLKFLIIHEKLKHFFQLRKWFFENYRRKIKFKYLWWEILQVLKCSETFFGLTKMWLLWETTEFKSWECQILIISFITLLII